MTQPSVVHLDPPKSKAALAVKRLIHQKHLSGQGSIAPENLETETLVSGFITADIITVAKKGAWLGGIFGAIIGAASIFATSISPLVAVGPFQAALRGSLASALAGAASGGLSGALVGWCIWWVGASREIISESKKKSLRMEIP